MATTLNRTERETSEFNGSDTSTVLRSGVSLGIGNGSQGSLEQLYEVCCEECCEGCCEESFAERSKVFVQALLMTSSVPLGLYFLTNMLLLIISFFMSMNPLDHAKLLQENYLGNGSWAFRNDSTIGTCTHESLSWTMWNDTVGISLRISTFAITFLWLLIQSFYSCCTCVYKIGKGRKIRDGKYEVVKGGWCHEFANFCRRLCDFHHVVRCCIGKCSVDGILCLFNFFFFFLLCGYSIMLNYAVDEKPRKGIVIFKMVADHPLVSGGPVFEKYCVPSTPILLNSRLINLMGCFCGIVFNLIHMIFGYCCLAMAKVQKNRKYIRVPYSKKRKAKNKEEKKEKGKNDVENIVTVDLSEKNGERSEGNTSEESD